MFSNSDVAYMRLALRLARKGLGSTSPNPMVGAVLVKNGKIIGRGWHHRAGNPHAEIEAILDAKKRSYDPAGATLYVTLEPCCTHGRTPPCTEAIIAARIRKVLIGAIDPNPVHHGRGFQRLRRAGIRVQEGLLSDECRDLNEAFNHWIVHRTPFVTVKAAMTLDGKIATESGASKWITSERSRAWAMQLRRGADALLVGINTILEDDPSLTVRSATAQSQKQARALPSRLRRIVLDSSARTPLTAKVVTDEHAGLTTIVVSSRAPARRIAALARRVQVIVAPLAESRSRQSRINLRWLLRRLGAEQVTSLLVEGGGEVNASFLLQGLAHRVTFFYAPMVVGGREAVPAVGGDGAKGLAQALRLTGIEWRKLGPDLLLQARVAPGHRKL